MWSGINLSNNSMTRLELNRPLISFDLETTGTDITLDRIIQIGTRKITLENGRFVHQDKQMMINPGIPISPEATEVHGISDDDVRGCPSFDDVAADLYQYFNGCDVLGYNSNRFDIPILSEHFMKVGLFFPKTDTKCIDVQVIFHEREPRNLEAAYKKYCNKSLGEDAHDAMADTIATAETLLGQLKMYDDLGGTVEELHEASQRGEKVVDFARKLVYDEDGEVCYNFGKSKGDRVKDNTGFAFWILDRDFPEVTKWWLRETLGMPHPKIETKEDEDIF